MVTETVVSRVEIVGLCDAGLTFYDAPASGSRARS
jgi:hypothetical protein